MRNTSTAVASVYLPGVSSCSSVRRRLDVGGAVASAAVLALSLVTATPDVHDAGTEVRAVRLAGFALPSPAYLAALETFTGNQAQIVAPVIKVAADGAAEIPAAVVVRTPAASVTNPLTFSAENPTINSQQLNNVALAETTAADPWQELWQQYVYPVIVGIILFGVVVVAYLNYIFSAINQAIADFLGLPTQPAASGASTAAGQANATAAPTLTSDPLVSDSVSVATATAEPADAAPTAETGKSGISPAVTSIDRPTETEQVTTTEPATGNEEMSTDTATSTTDDVTETGKAAETSTEPTSTSAPEPSASAPISVPAKATARPATPRPVVRGSLEVREHVRDLPHHGNGGRPTTRTPAAGESSGGDAGDS